MVNEKFSTYQRQVFFCENLLATISSFYGNIYGRNVKPLREAVNGILF